MKILEQVLTHTITQISLNDDVAKTKNKTKKTREIREEKQKTRESRETQKKDEMRKFVKCEKNISVFPTDGEKWRGARETKHSLRNQTQRKSRPMYSYANINFG